MAVLPLIAGGALAAGAARALLDQREDEQPQALSPIRQSTLSPTLPPDVRQRLEASYQRLGIPTERVIAPPRPPEPESPGVLGTLGDLATSATAGSLDAAAGLANLTSVVPRAVGLPEVSSDIAGGLSTAADFIRERGLSPAAQEQSQAFAETLQQNASGSILDRMRGAAGALVDNPRYAGNLVAEMAPMMVGAGLIGRGLQATGAVARPLTGAALGEGAIAAGMASSGIREATGGENPLAELAALPIGAATAAVPIAGGSILNRMAASGIAPISKVATALNAADPESLIAGAARSTSPLYARVPAGAFREGVLEELPQTVLETGLQNLATGQPFSEGLVEDATIGTLLGGTLGAGFSIPGAPQVAPEPPPAPSVDPLVAYPRPEKTGVRATDWATAAATMAEQDAKTQDQVREVLKNTKGIGAKIQENIERSDWFKNLPTDSQEAAPAKANDPELYDVPEDPEADLVDAAEDEAFTADIEEALNLPPDDDFDVDPDDVDPDGLKATEPKKGKSSSLPENRRVGRIKPSPQYNIHRAIYSMIKGVFPGAPAAAKPLDRESGKVRSDVPAWRRQANIAASVLNNIDAKGILNDDETPLDLAGQIHRRTLELQRLGNILGSQNAVATLGGRSGNTVVNAVKRDTAEALRENATDNAGVAELDIFSDFDLAMDRNPDASPNEVLQGILEKRNIDFDSAVAKYEELARGLDNMYGQLEELVGQDNLMLAMYAGKKAQFNGTRLKLPGDKTTSETSEAVRFSQFYAKYRAGTTADMSVPAKTIRHESELTRRLSPIVDGTNPDQLENIALGNTLPPNVVNSIDPQEGRSRVYNVLQHIRLISQAPAAKRLASALMDIAEANNLHIAAADARLAFVVDKKSSEKRGSGHTLGLFQPALEAKGAAPDRVGQITIYRRGATERTILHEILHALSVSVIRNNPNSPGARNLATIGKHLSRFGRPGKGLEDIRTKYGAEVAHTLETLNELQNSDTPHRVALETLTYGLTSAEFQKFLRSKPYAGPKLGKYNPRNMWHAFRGAVARMLGASKVPNSLMDAVLEASSSVLYDASAENALGTVLDTVPLEASSPKKPWHTSDPNKVAKSPAARKELEARRAKEHTSAADLAKAAAGLSKQAKNKADAEQAQLKEDLRRITDEFAAKQGRSKVDTSKPAPARDMLLTDKAMRTMMDSLAGLFPGAAGRDYETAMQMILDKGAAKFITWAAQQNNLVQKVITSILIGTVDRLGIDPAADNLVSRAITHLHTGTHNAMQAYQELHGASLESSQAVLDYLENRDEAALRGKINGEGAERAIDHVIKVVEDLEELATKLAAIGKLDKTFIDEATGRVNLRPLISPSKGKHLQLGRKQITGAVTARRSSRVNNRVDNDANIIGTAGKTITKQPAAGVRFRRALAKDGEVFYVDTRAGDKVYADRDLVPTDELPFELSTKLRGDATARMSRYKTAAEMKQSREESEVIPSIINTAHYWTRLLAFNELTDSMMRDNEGIPDGDGKYIYDEPPADIPEHRLITEKSVSDASERGLFNVQERMTKLARVPGTFVKLPDPGEPGADQWGAMAGKWVAGPVYAALKDQSNDEPIIDSDNYQAFLRIWKKNKTVWSPGTHMQNVLGNVILMYMHDIPGSHVRQAFRLLFRDWAEENQNKFSWAKSYASKHPLSREERALVDEFKSSGATLGQFKTADFDAGSFGAAAKFAEKHAKEEAGDSGSNRGLVKTLMEMEGVMGRLISGLSVADDALMDLYSNQDNVFRMAAYMTHLQRASANSGGATTVQMKEEAAKYANESFVNYNITAPWVRAMRGTITPFIAFPYRMVPLMTRLAVTKPWKTATVLGTIYALNAVGYAVSGGDEDEERTLVADYMKDGVWFSDVPTYIRMPFGVDDETPVFLPLGGMVPVASALTLDPSGSPRMFAASGPAITALYAAIGYDPFMQRQLREEGASTVENVSNTVGYLFRGLAPQVAVSAYKAYDNQLKDGGRLGPLGSEASGYLDLARIAGLNMTQVNLPEQRLRQSQAIQRIKSDYGRARNSYIKRHLRRGETDPSDIRDYVIQNREAMLEAIEEELE